MLSSEQQQYKKALLENSICWNKQNVQIKQTDSRFNVMLNILSLNVSSKTTKKKNLKYKCFF